MFRKLQEKVTQRAKILEKMGTLFRVDLPRDHLVEAYLNTFTDPGDRQHHNCNCCRSFLRHYAGIVAIKNGKVETLWDFEIDGIYSEVPLVLHQLVMNASIRGVFASTEERLGTQLNRQKVEGTTQVKIWNHFFWHLPKDSLYRGAKTLDTYLGDQNTDRQVLHRALTEIKLGAVETIAELISENAIYRGKEYEKGVKAFLELKRKFDSLDDRSKILFSWENRSNPHSRIGNNVMGELIYALSEGKELEHALRAYHKMTAPENFQQTSAPVTSKMYDDARKELTDLGLEPALHRRYAVPSDITANNVLFMNRSKPPILDVFDQAKQDTAINARTIRPTATVHIYQFLTDYLPQATDLELLVEGRHQGNFVTMVAPVHADSPPLFQWSNNMSWSYPDGLADSMKQKVEKAGGKTSGALRISLEWFNYDDLDLRCKEHNGNLISFRDKTSRFSGGQLDVDMNAGHGHTREPVENIIFPDARRILEGVMEIVVHNYHKRESKNGGFNVEIEGFGEFISFNYAHSPKDDEYIVVAKLKYSKDSGIELISGGPTKASVNSREINGIGTNKFHKVSIMCLSPNHWGPICTGNKHFFFLLDGAKSEKPPRAFLNEFLRHELKPHRKAFQNVGGKIVVQPSESELTGIGISETQNDHCFVKLNGQIIKVTFGAITNV